MPVEFWKNRSERGRWYLVALGLLLGGDLLTTMWAVSMIGLSGEANPVMRWLLGHDIAVVLAVHAVIGVFAIFGFIGIIRIEQHLDGATRTQYVRCSRLWVGGLVLAGMLVVFNNLLVIAAATT